MGALVAWSEVAGKEQVRYVVIDFAVALIQTGPVRDEQASWVTQLGKFQGESLSCPGQGLWKTHIATKGTGTALLILVIGYLGRHQYLIHHRVMLDRHPRHHLIVIP